LLTVIKMLQILSISLLLSQFLLIQGYIIDDPLPSSTLALYSDTDNVIELTNESINEIRTDKSIWIVEFYNHWCGHCRRFVPTWKSVADSLKMYEPYVKVAAINCATQTACEDYMIQGTPTIRIFNPRSNPYWSELSSDWSAQLYVTNAKSVLRRFFPEINMNSPYPNTISTFPSIITSTTARPFVRVENKLDIVHQDDIEKAIQYALTTEIPMKPHMHYPEISALYKFLDSLVKNTPNLKEKMKNFLISLREWPQIMGLTSITGKQYKERVMELEDFYKPFSQTAEDFVYCKGSDPQYRGYPCSLWTLFHALTVNSESIVFQSHGMAGMNQVAEAIIGYVDNFFSCKDCARHFISGVRSMSYPYSDKETIFWLYTLHNKANRRLAGDATEDPQFPKIQWPSKQNCPQCVIDSYNYMTGRLERIIQFQNVVDYMKRIYGEENIEQNNLIDEEENLKDSCLATIPDIQREQCKAVLLH